jgi:hypothetical protein
VCCGWLGTFLGWLTVHVAVGLRIVLGETTRSIGISFPLAKRASLALSGSAP